MVNDDFRLNTAVTIHREFESTVRKTKGLCGLSGFRPNAPANATQLTADPSPVPDSIHQRESAVALSRGSLSPTLPLSNPWEDGLAI